MQFQVMYHRVAENDPIIEDNIFDDYRQACEYMQELANDIFDNQGYTGLLSMEVIGLPSIGAGDYA